jgi:hypothetical protein
MDCRATEAGRHLMAADLILLGDVAARTHSITVVCRLCPRSGRRRTDRLLAEHGPDMPITTVLKLNPRPPCSLNKRKAAPPDSGNGLKDDKDETET